MCMFLFLLRLSLCRVLILSLRGLRVVFSVLRGRQPEAWKTSFSLFYRVRDCHACEGR